MKKILFITILILSISNTYSQKILLSQNVKNDSIKPKWGPNRKNFTYMFFGYAVLAGKSHDDLKTKYPGTSEFSTGLIYKNRISNIYAWGFKLSYDLKSFLLKPNSILSSCDSAALKQTYPGISTKTHSKEKEIFNSLSLTLYNRFNFDKRRGNNLGHYLDIGAFGSYNYNIKHYTKDNINGNTIKTRISSLSYADEFAWGIYAGFGIKNFLIYYKYIVPDYFKDSYNLPELPHSAIGIQISIGNISK